MNSDCKPEHDRLSCLLHEVQPKFTMFGHQENDPDATCAVRINSNYELIYFLGGTGIVCIDGIEHILHKGDWCFIPAFVSNSIDTPADDIHHNYWMHFDLNESIIAGNMRDALCSAFRGYVWHMGLRTDIIAMLEAVEQEEDRNECGCERLKEICFETIFIKLCRACRMDAYLPEIRRPYNAVWQNLSQFMQHSYMRLHTVSQIAQEIHISESYCTKLCRDYLGIPPAKYVMQLKMKEAVRLLLYSDNNVQQISEILGFSSAYHFINTFRKHFDMSPGSYRKIKLSL